MERLGGCRVYRPDILTEAGRGQEPAAHTDEDEDEEEEGGEGGGGREDTWLLPGERRTGRW